MPRLRPQTDGHASASAPADGAQEPEDGGITKAEYEELARFRYALRRFLRFAERAARAAGVTPQQYQSLLAIKGFPGRDWASVGELAERLQLQHNSAVGIVDRCEQAGLVERSADPEDRRQVRVTLTPRGEEVLRLLASQNRQELARIRRDLRPLLREPRAGPSARPENGRRAPG
jgi:DNA-binding MarR family transcriptional regulator